MLHIAAARQGTTGCASRARAPKTQFGQEHWLRLSGRGAWSPVSITTGTAAYGAPGVGLRLKESPDRSASLEIYARLPPVAGL
jgi:hypothetical protein